MNQLRLQLVLVLVGVLSFYFLVRHGWRSTLWIVGIFAVSFLLGRLNQGAKRQWASMLKGMPPAGRTTVRWLQRTGQVIILSLWVWSIWWRLQQGENPEHVAIQTLMLLTFGLLIAIPQYLDKRISDKASAPARKANQRS